MHSTRDRHYLARHTIRLPKQVDPQHLVNGEALLDPAEIDAVKMAFHQLPKQANDATLQRLTFLPTHGKLKKITILKFTDTAGQESFFAAYLGKKHNKHLGNGANGNVKLMQNIDTLTWSSLKVFTIPKDEKRAILTVIEKEERNLALLGRKLGSGFYYKTIEHGEVVTKYYLGMELAYGSNVKKTILNHCKIRFDMNFNSHSLECNLDINSIYIYKHKDVHGDYICQYYDRKAAVWRKKIINQIESDLVFLSILQKFDTSVNSLQSLDVDELQDKPFYDKLCHFFGIPVTPLDLPPLHRLIAVSREMINALEVIHAAGIIHCDVKPEQFILDPETGEVTLIDLGSGLIHSGSHAPFFSGITVAYASTDLLRYAQLNKDPIVQERLNQWWVQNCSSVGSLSFEDYWQKNMNFSSYWRKTHPENAHPDSRNDNQYTADIEQDKKNYLQTEESKLFQLTKKRLIGEVSKESRLFNFTKVYDIYSLGMSIGLFFGLVESVHTHDHFGLNQPEYINPTKFGGAFSIIYQIKSLEKAKKYNLYLLSDDLLEKVVKFLQQMTHIDPTQRPTLKASKQFFIDFEIALIDYASYSTHLLKSSESYRGSNQLSARTSMASLLPASIFNHQHMVVQHPHESTQYCPPSSHVCKISTG